MGILFGCSRDPYLIFTQPPEDVEFMPPPDDPFWDEGEWQSGLWRRRQDDDDNNGPGSSQMA
jgi:hypothetical protein